MTKTDWISKAGKLCTKLQNEGINTPSISTAKEYSEVRSVIFSDHHHIPQHARSSTLVIDVRQWMTDTRNGVYDNRFK